MGETGGFANKPGGVPLVQGASDPGALASVGKRPLVEQPAPGAVVQREAATGGKAPDETEKVGATLYAKDTGGKDLPPSIDDVKQGGLNDCFAFAAMAAIVHSDPSRINGMIKDNGNATYTVVFQGTGFITSDSQTVTADFAKGKHGKVGARNAFWPLIIEKAYGQNKG